jgi:uncharacterized protein (DUF1697 family)
MRRLVALLRGINVGGSNRLPMADLRATMHELGFANVATHIQSGNIVFDHPDDVDERTVADRIAAALVERHGLTVPVIVRTGSELAGVTVRHPDAGGPIESTLLHVVFLDAAPEPDMLDSIDAARFAPDRFTVDGREVFVTYPNGSARSKLTIEVFERAFGCRATARNLNTVAKLADII